MKIAITEGTIYEIDFPFPLPGEDTARTAVALETPGPDGRLEFALLSASLTTADCAVLIDPASAFDGWKSAPAQIYRLPAASVRAAAGSAPVSFLGDLFRLRASHAARGHYRFAHQKAEFVPGQSNLPYAGRVYDDREMVNLTDSALDFWLTGGRWSDQFERGLGKFVGARKVLLANSGSSANLIALSTLTSPKLGDRRLLPGDEVISVAAGFPATITPIIQNRLVPVFVDVELPSYNIDWTQLEAALSPRTKAVFLAHTLGNPFDLARVRSFCEKNQLWLIEDNCDALGTEYFIDGEWKKTGSIGDLGTFSFYPPHHITMGEGGAVCTSRVALEKIALSFRDWGRDCWCDSGKDNTCGKRFEHELGELPFGYDHKYIYSHFGYNLKATDMQAAVGCAQLDKLPTFVQKRRHNWQRLRDGLGDLGEFFVLPEPMENSRPSWFGFLLTVKPKAPFGRKEIVAHLESKKIQTRMLFAGNFLRHPAFDEMRREKTGYRQIGNLRVTDQIMQDTFWVGVYPGRTESELDYMIESIRTFCKR